MIIEELRCSFLKGEEKLLNKKWKECLTFFKKGKVELFELKLNLGKSRYSIIVRYYIDGRGYSVISWYLSLYYSYEVMYLKSYDLEYKTKEDINFVDFEDELFYFIRRETKLNKDKLSPFTKYLLD